MTTLTPTSPDTDADLVARSLTGDRDAYAAIVARHQSTICALTFAATGDLHQSQDLAQETFLAAWKDLRGLKDPAHLRPWLRGIARNLVHSARRKHSRSPAGALPDADRLASDAPTPPDQAITREEHALLWQNLAQLPEDYREPLVLYYRQGESTAAVAAALDISEDAARQRLSRGRAMLARRIEHLIDRGLRHGGPTPAFTLAVITALPAVTATRIAATAAAAGASAKATAATKAASTAAGILGPLSGFLGAYLGYRIGLAQTIAPQERRFIRRFFAAIVAWAAAFTLVLLVANHTLWRTGLDPRRGHPEILVALVLVYAGVIAVACLWYSRRLRLIRAAVTTGRPDMQAAARASAAFWNFRYRSRAAFLGLPLIDVHIGANPDMTLPAARGWIAIGAKAYGGLFALGAIAVAPLSWGGFSAGAVTYGGFALGWWSVGVVAFGVKSIGACALGWTAASGIVAVAHRYAAGIAAGAPHVYDDAAHRFFTTDRFFNAWDAILRHAAWIWPIPLLVLVPFLARARRLRQTPNPEP